MMRIERITSRLFLSKSTELGFANPGYFFKPRFRVYINLNQGSSYFKATCVYSAYSWAMVQLLDPSCEKRTSEREKGLQFIQIHR